MRYFFIVNPIAGRGECKEKWRLIKEEVEQVGLDYEVAFTRAPGDGVFLAKEGIEKGFDILVAVGGDGTINEVIKGIIQEDMGHKIYLGIIAAGTGNDLVRTLNIPQNISAAVEVLQKANVQIIDMGRVNGDYFINVVGVGFDGAIAYEVNHNVKWLKGTAAYLYGVLKVLFQYKSPQMRIQIDDLILEGKYILVAIANGKYYGGGMMIAPGAEIDDGQFEIVVVEDVDKLEVLKVLPTIFKGNHIKHPAVRVYHGKKVYLHSPEKVLIQADGELKGTLPMGFELKSQALSVLIP